MSKRTQSTLTSLAVLIIVCVSMLFGRSGPGTRSGGDPKDADYCNVLLVPSIAEQIGLDLPQRIRAADAGARMLTDLKLGTDIDPMVPSGHAHSDAAGTKLLASYGREARALLSPASQEAFRDLFSSGELVRVGYWMHEGTGEKIAGGDRFWVTYGLYEEEKERVGQKSLNACEDALRANYRWIASAAEANGLTEHEDEVVREAAEIWWEENPEAFVPAKLVYDVTPALTAEEAERESRERQEGFEERMAEFWQQRDELRANEIGTTGEVQEQVGELESRVAESLPAALEPAEPERSSAQADELRTRVEQHRAEVEQRMQESRERMAADREALRAEVEARQQAVRDKLEARRRENQ